MATIALNFEDGYTRIIEGKNGETVANSAFSSRINIPLDCNDGVCGTCKCRVRSGSFDMGDEYIKDAISDKEIAEGYALACQMVPKSDMVIDILASSAACKVKNETFTTTITALEFLSSEIVKLSVKTQDGRKVNFLPGQYANIEIPNSGGKTRSFSFSGKTGTDTLEFIMRLLPDGLASNYLRDNAKEGEILNITAPFGSFYLRDINAPTLFFAGGTGIAPFLAMLENLVHVETRHALSLQEIPPIQLFYGATTDENLVELDRLDSFKSKLPFQYQTCVSIEQSEKHAHGFVNQWITKDYLGENVYDMYICGPPPMVDAVKKSVHTEGVAQSHFYEEKFNPSGS
jgi:benzoate/toluate 1,2-dioxygenase reductase component